MKKMEETNETTKAKCRPADIDAGSDGNGTDGECGGNRECPNVFRILLGSSIGHLITKVKLLLPHNVLK